LTHREEATTHTSIGSLVLPWTAIAIAAILCTAVAVLGPTSFQPPQPQQHEELQDGGVSEQTLVSEMMQQEDRFLSMKSFDMPHKPLFPLDKTDVYGFFCCLLGLLIAAGGGIGGGGVLVPIYILVMKFSPKHAIPLSNITVFGGAIANTLLNTRKRHPLVNRPLVDWDLILVMEPLTILGALMGAFINKLLDETLLVIMLILLLSVTSYTTLKKAGKMYAAESRAMRDQQGLRADGTKESELTRIVHTENDDDDEEAGHGLLSDVQVQDGETPGSGESSSSSSSSSLEEETNEREDEHLDQELKDIYKQEEKVPMANLKVLVAMFLVVLFINLMKGGGAFKSPLGIKCGSTSFWVSNAIMVGWIVTISLFARAYLVRRWEEKQRLGYKYAEGDIEWDPRATIVYPGICCMAGLFAGMFGVGGGIVKGPLMLAMGVHPKVSSASSACMILFTSFTATTSFMVFGLLIPDYAVVCLVIGFCATLLGQIGLFYLMQKYQRNSYIAFSIGGIVLLSAFLMTIQSLISLAEGNHSSSGGICGKPH